MQLRKFMQPNNWWSMDMSMMYMTNTEASVKILLLAAQEKYLL